jgi:RNA polymerase-binding protein DksA
MTGTDRQQDGSITAFTMEDVQQVLREHSQHQGQKPTVTRLDAPLSQTARKSTGKRAVKIAIKRQAASVFDILGFDPSTSNDDFSQSAYTRGKIPEKWIPQFDALMQMQDDLAERLRQHTAETLLQGDVETLDRSNSLGQHSTDGAAEEVDLERTISSVESERELLHEVQDALERMQRGTYGICEQTGENIPLERLNAIPFTRYSLRGQKEYEQNRHTATSVRGSLFATADDDGADLLAGANGDGEE